MSPSVRPPLMLCALLLEVACQSTPAAAPTAVATGPAQRTPASTLELKLERGTLAVKTAVALDTGTMHFADQLELSLDGGAPLIVRSRPLEGIITPIASRLLPVQADRALLLGWSSTGGGMQALHALLLQVEDGRVSVRDELRVITDRRQPHLAYRLRDGVLTIAVVLPRCALVSEDPAHDHACPIHEATSWGIHTRARSWSLREAADALRFQDLAEAGSWLHFCPPMQQNDLCAQHLGPALQTQATFFDVGSSEFRPIR